MRALLALTHEILRITRLQILSPRRLDIDERRIARPADVRVALVSRAVLGELGGVGGDGDGGGAEGGGGGVGVVGHCWVQFIKG